MTDNEIFSYIKAKNDYKEEGLNFDYKVEVDKAEKCIIVYFKETDSDVDWLLARLFLPMKIKLGLVETKVPRGYGLAYLSGHKYMLQDVINEYNKHPDFDICCRGWSEGSMFASMAMIEIASFSNKPIKELLTFGTVSCFKGNVSKLKNCALSIRQYVTANDFATWCVPFYRAINKIKCGPKFNLFKIITKTAWYHSNYDKLI